MAERYYQARLIKKLRVVLEDCIILKNDSGYLQGVPDLIVLWRDRWAMLEVKDHEGSPFQPNQEWYLEKLNGMSFAAVVYPENEDEVLHALQQAFGLRRSARSAKRK
jgi:hypothetical protein